MKNPINCKLKNLQLIGLMLPGKVSGVYAGGNVTTMGFGPIERSN